MHFGHASFDAVCSELSEGGPDSIGIVRGAKGCAEWEQLIVRLESPDRGGHGQCFFERLFLESTVRVKINLRRFNGLVSQPQSYYGAIYTGEVSAYAAGGSCDKLYLSYWRFPFACSFVQLCDGESGKGDAAIRSQALGLL